MEIEGPVIQRYLFAHPARPGDYLIGALCGDGFLRQLEQWEFDEINARTATVT